MMKMISDKNIERRIACYFAVMFCVFTFHKNSFSQTTLTADPTPPFASVNTTTTPVIVNCGNNGLTVTYSPAFINVQEYDIYYSYTVVQAHTTTIFLTNAITYTAAPSITSEQIVSIGIASIGFSEVLSPFANAHTTAPISFVPGTYIIKVRYHHTQVAASVSFYTMNFNCTFPPPPCVDCIPSFAPLTDKKYMVSAWAKQEGAAPTVTSYATPKLTISSTVGAAYSASFVPSGPIIDGWQKIDGEFFLPVAATDINITLECTIGNCFFDDIRVFPFDGSMKSYVYDPITMRLVAELDERNYATLYEYDEEGKLVRVKKETERGIMTIKESRNNTSK